MWNQAHALMQQARQANYRLHLHKHQYSIGDHVWLWNLEWIKQLIRNSLLFGQVHGEYVLVIHDPYG